MKPRILLDIDGVCANFAAPVVALSNKITDRNHTEDDVHEWDMASALGWTPEVSKQIDAAIASPDFCYRLPVYEGALDGVNMLREFADVYPVTATFNSPHWVREREQWLDEYLGFNRRDVTFTGLKHFVVGDVLIDDKTSTLVEWRKHHPRGLAILFSRPWNHRDEWSGIRANDWTHLVAALKLAFGIRPKVERKPDELGWLIEIYASGRSMWWTGHSWTVDSLSTIRYAREADAQRAIKCDGLENAIAVEHMWCAP